MPRKQFAHIRRTAQPTRRRDRRQIPQHLTRNITHRDIAPLRTRQRRRTLNDRGHFLHCSTLNGKQVTSSHRTCHNPPRDHQVTPLTRRERIELLLEHWPDYYECAAKDDGPSGDGGVFLMPGMSRHPSVVELRRALIALRQIAPSSAGQIIGFYSAPYRCVDRQRRIRGKNGKFGYVPERRRERIVPAWVRAQKVEDGVTLIAQEPADEAEAERRPWCFRGQPFLPTPVDPNAKAA